MAAPRPKLRKLAEKLGIMSSYVDATGVRRFTSDATRMALVEAMGWNAGTENEAANALQQLVTEEHCRGHHFGFISENKDLRRIALPISEVTKQPVRYEVELSHYADEPRTRSSGQIKMPIRGNVIPIRLPAPLRRGHNHVKIALDLNGESVARTYFAFVTPDRCWLPQTLRKNRTLRGVCTNLYTLRSGRNWGVGDIADLEQLVEWMGRHGGDFVGLNPLHYVSNIGERISPYSPSSRMFRNPIYIDVERVPEFRYSVEARQLYGTQVFQSELKKLRASTTIDYDAVLAAKVRILRLLYQDFRRNHLDQRRQTARARAYARYCWSHAVGNFAEYCAIDCYWRESASINDWRNWPSQLRNFSPEATASFTKANGLEAGFYSYLQFELDRQLGELEVRGRKQGLRLGLFQDFAVGSAADGFDTWAWQSSFVTGVEVGCPPDAHSTVGQNWSFHPLNPWKLQKHSFVVWDWLVQRSMRLAGMLRIDHAMGLLRQFWIPKGCPPSEGAYVKFPFEQLCRLLAYYSRLYKTVVVGEDLGTVPKGFSELLEKRGILSTRMMMFERSRGGGFKSAKSYRRNAVASATNHDLPPLKGYVNAADLELRRRIGLFKNKTEWVKAIEQRKLDVKALLRRLVQEKLLSRDEARDPAALSHDRLVEAVHGFLAKTPSRVIAVMLDDLFGESEPINLPGVGPDQHASWTRRMSTSLEDGLKDKQVVRMLEAAMPKKRTRSKMIRK